MQAGIWLLQTAKYQVDELKDVGQKRRVLGEFCLLALLSAESAYELQVFKSCV